MWWKFRKKEGPSQEVDSAELRESGRAPLSEITRQVKRVEVVTKRKSQTQLSGDYKSRFRGQGVQFADFRPYQYGDDVRHIDWRTSARQQHAVVKTFEEERELNVVIALDVSPSSGFGTQGRSKREALCLAVAAVAFSAIANNDRVGLVLFSDRVERFVPPRKGKKHVLRIIDELLAHKPRGKGTNFTPALELLATAVRGNSVVLLASDFFSQIDRRKIRQIARRHDLIALHVRDPRDLEFPAIGLVQLEDPETGEQLVVDTSSTEVRKHLTDGQKKHLAKVLDLFRTSGIAVAPITTAGNPVDEIAEFFHSRRARGRR